jgi:hypothetical protein
MSAALKISVIYAAADRKPLDRLMTHLAPLFEYELLKWVEIAIRPDLQWKPVISEKFLESDLVLYLVCPDSLQPFCYEDELADHKEQGRVIPILMRDALLDESPLADIQALPRSSVSVFRSAASAESRLAQLAKEIRREVSRLQHEKYGFDTLPVSIDASVRDLLGRIPVEFVDNVLAAEISNALFKHLSEFGSLNAPGDTRLHKRLVRALNTARDRLARELRFYRPDSACELANAVFVQWALARSVISGEGQPVGRSAASSFVEAVMSYVTGVLAEGLMALRPDDVSDAQLPTAQRHSAALTLEPPISVWLERLEPVKEGFAANTLRGERTTGKAEQVRKLVRALPYETQRLAA